MLKTIIKPMINHTVLNASSIDRLDDSLFPLCYTPFVKGILINVQKGHVFLTYDNRRLTNYTLLTMLEEVRLTSLKMGYILSIVLTSRQTNDCLLLADVLSHNRLLPADLTFHFTDVVKDDCIEEMERGQRNANLWYLKTLNGLNNAIFHQQGVAKDVEELKELIAPILFDANVNGITVHKPNGKYTEGFNQGNFDSMNIDCSKEVTGKIVNIKSIKRTVGKTAGTINVLSKIKIELPNGCVVTHHITEASLQERLTMWMNKGVLYDAPVVVEINEIPSRREPIVRRVISIA